MAWIRACGGASSDGKKYLIKNGELKETFASTFGTLQFTKSGDYLNVNGTNSGQNHGHFTTDLTKYTKLYIEGYCSGAIRYDVEKIGFGKVAQIQDQGQIDPYTLGSSTENVFEVTKASNSLNVAIYQQGTSTNWHIKNMWLE